MSSRTKRILKEARSLFWPWCAVIMAGALRLVEQSDSALMGGGPLWGVHLIEPISFIGFFLGIPLLATLSLGNEFQHRTLSLLLSQPVGRMEIWGEKMSVMIVAVLSAALVFCYGWRSALQQDPQLWVIAGAVAIAMIASATFWTLVARSTMGGLALNGVNSLIPLAWFTRRDWIPETMTARSVTAFAFLCYIGVMLWLGRRTLARFQVTGGMAGEDLLMAGPDVMPGAMAGWSRCRPTGAVLNLIRKEVRLLRPVWLVSLLGLFGWICLPTFGFTLERRSALAAIMVIAFTPLIAVLAGSLSLGEERSSGTHSWHMTLPVPARRQWLIKLFMAMFTGLVCAVLLPSLALIASRFILGSPLMFVDPGRGMAWVLWVSLLTFASFWCACAVNGTVRAVLWIFPAMSAVYLAGRCGHWVARQLMDLVVLSFDPFRDFRFTSSVSNIQLPVINSTPRTVEDLARVVALLLVPTLLFAVIHSYRLFRAQPQDSTLSVIRNLLPLATVAFLCTFSLMAFYAFVAHAKQQMWTLFSETHEAIERIQPGTANLDATHLLQFTVEDLVRAAPISDRTRRWLDNSNITVSLYRGLPPNGISKGVTVAPDKANTRYSATIHLARGSDCTLAFEAGRGYGNLGGVCE